MDEIVGYIERITFQNPENGYTVAKIQQPKQRDVTCIVGTLPSIQPGETVRCYGSWKNHLVHGRQFIVEKYRSETPATVEGIKKYLGSGLVKGIGPAYAEKIVNTFGADTLEVIDATPSKLKGVPGIGKKRLQMIIGCWSEQKTIRELMLFLQKYSINPTHANRIYKTYGDHSVAKIEENPYALAKDIFGIGFKTADQMAMKMGVEKDSVKRIDAGIEFALSELSNDGHVCYPVELFVKVAHKYLDVPPEAIGDRLENLNRVERIKLADIPGNSFGRFIWLRPLYLAERGIAREVWRLKKEPCFLREVDKAKAIEWVQEKLHIQLAKNQSKAVEKSLSEKVHIITGGPGTGKSTITNAILSIHSKLTQRIMLAAPTGRAAKRMAEITGRKAQTIHSLLEFDFRTGGFKKNRENPLECDLIIIDEASMIDTPLMNQLLRAIPSSARVILVGDINQLPSVGPGNVLKDLIDSKVIAVTKLNEIFRQAEGSKIITNAHAINQGMMPDLDNEPGSDFFYIEAETPEEVVEQIVGLASERLKKKYGFDPFEEIQILAPMKKGAMGIDNLNTLLQDQLNPKDESLLRAGRRFRKGDKVMQLRNNYQKEVYNGDVGIIDKIDFVNQELLLTIDGRLVKYDFAELDELVLAYAVSIHKYQGSECPCVVIPIHTSHFMMLRRNLFYTGVTRGKKIVVIVGSKKAIGLAVRNDDVRQRFTALKEAILGKIHE